jgi:hypothetical protein
MMLCYKDRTYCAASCANHECDRQFTQADRDQATKWWGGPDFPVALCDFSAGCSDYQPKDSLQTETNGAD